MHDPTCAPRALHPRRLGAVLASALVAFLAGCGDPGIRVSQSVELRVLDASGAVPLAPTFAYRIAENLLQPQSPLSTQEILSTMEGRLQTPPLISTSGLVALRFDRVELCTSYDSGLGPSCDKIAAEDFVTGNTVSVGVRSPDQSEILTLELLEGQRVVGESFLIEVIGIGLPSGDDWSEHLEE